MIKKIFESKKNIIITIIIAAIIIELIVIIFFKPASDTNLSSISKPTPSPQKSSTIQPQTPKTSQGLSKTIVSPTLTNQPTPTVIDEEILDLDYRRPLSRLLPYQGKYFKSNRYVGTNKLEILVKNKADTELAKKEAQAWLVENGVDQDDEIIISYRY